MTIMVLRGGCSPCEMSEHVRDAPFPQSSLWDSCSANCTTSAVFLAVPCTGFHTPHEFLAHIKGGRDKRSQVTISQRDTNASGSDPSSSSATTVPSSQCTHPVLSVPLCSRLPGCPLSLHPEGCTHQLLAPTRRGPGRGKGLPAETSRFNVISLTWNPPETSLQINLILLMTSFPPGLDAFLPTSEVSQ